MSTKTHLNSEGIHEVRTQINELKYRKLDSSIFQDSRRLIHFELDTLKRVSTNHENHFAMVENFVEKYVPIKTQTHISKTLHFVFQHTNMHEALEQLDEYEDTTFAEMHQVVLEDEGMPDLRAVYRDIRFDIKQIMDQKYQAPKIISRLKQSFIH